MVWVMLTKPRKKIMAIVSPIDVHIYICYVPKPRYRFIYMSIVYSFQNDSVFNSCTSVHIIRLYFQAFSKVCVCVCQILSRKPLTVVSILKSSDAGQFVQNPSPRPPIQIKFQVYSKAFSQLNVSLNIRI